MVSMLTTSQTSEGKMSRNWHAEHSKRGISIGEGYSFARRVYLVNPTCKTWHRHSYVLWFGACGVTYLHVYADSLEDAIEECAAWLANHAPGHIMNYGSEEHADLIKEVCEERGITFDPDRFHGVIDSEASDILSEAEADLTYTESGFLTSYEWGLSLEDPTTAELYAFIGGK